MKRYPSLDLMRGLAIFMMVVFHVIMRWYDRQWLEDGELEGVSVLMLVFMGSVVFFSAWAGFFLLVSSISNMISMQKVMERGLSWKRLMLYQVAGGSILLVAAILVESTIGYHGYMGEVVEGNLDGWPIMLYRGFHMETIHTIALCIIVNGVVQALLMRKGGVKKPGRNIKIYAVLAIGVIALTGPVYWVLRRIIPGYPDATFESQLVGKAIEVQYAVIGESPLGEVLLKAVMMPFGAMPEPLFPFLALSFVGSMIGIYLTEGKRSLKFIRKGIFAGAALFVIGALGTAAVLLLDQYPADDFLTHFFEIPALYPGAWLWWFLCVSGAQMAVVFLFLRSIEFRGKARPLGRRSLVIRRYGFVAFSIYTFQFIDVLPRLVYQLIPDLADMYPYPKDVSELLCLILIPMTVLLWEVILRSWEKVHFAFGMEWWIAKLVEKMFPKKREGTGSKLKWYEVKRLDPVGYLRRPQWLDVRKPDHKNLEDSRLARNLAIAGLLLFPLSLISLSIAKDAKRTEPQNSFRSWAVILSITGLVLNSSLFMILGFVFI